MIEGKSFPGRPAAKLFRINTCEGITKQGTLSPVGSTLLQKHNPSRVAKRSEKTRAPDSAPIVSWWIFSLSARGRWYEDFRRRQEFDVRNFGGHTDGSETALLASIASDER